MYTLVLSVRARGDDVREDAEGGTSEGDPGQICVKKLFSFSIIPSMVEQGQVGRTQRGTSGDVDTQTPATLDFDNIEEVVLANENGPNRSATENPLYQ